MVDPINNIIRSTHGTLLDQPKFFSNSADLHLWKLEKH